MVKKIKRITYPIKYEELIREYGEEEGLKKYIIFLKGVSLEKYILKYGDKVGTEKFEKWKENNKKRGCSLEKLILRHGEDKGRKIFEKWKTGVRMDLEAHILRYGKEEGSKKFKTLREKNSKNLRIAGKNRLKESFNSSIEYWVKKCDGDVEKAKVLYKERQDRGSLGYYIKKYGKEGGSKKYIKVGKAKSQTLENAIRIHGEVKGKEKFERYTANIKSKRTSSYYIKKYGEEYYQNLLIRRKNTYKGGYSNIGLEFCESVKKEIDSKYTKVYYGDFEYVFFVGGIGEFKLISPDLYIKELNLVIEFYGDFWHRNPKVYISKEDENCRLVWKKDEKRINILKERFGCNIIIVWEKDYRENKKEVINKVISEIKKYEK